MQSLEHDGPLSQYLQLMVGSQKFPRVLHPPRHFRVRCLLKHIDSQSLLVLPDRGAVFVRHLESVGQELEFRLQ